MKKLFGKRFHRIPVALVSVILAVVLIAGGALATFTVWTQGSAEITVLESIRVLDAGDIEEDWSHQNALCFLPGTIYPGQGTCEKYLIHNMGPVPISITVTQTEPAGTEFAGLALEWSNSTADLLMDESNTPLAKICLNTEGEQILTYTFTIGTYEYAGDLPETPLSGGERYTEAKGDSAYVKVFAGFKVLDDVDPITDIEFTVTVGRG